MSHYFILKGTTVIESFKTIDSENTRKTLTYLVRYSANKLQSKNIHFYLNLIVA